MMRKIMLPVLLAICLPLSVSLAQTDRRETQSKDSRRDLGDRLRSRIEEFIDYIGRELGYEDTAPTDTIPKSRPKEPKKPVEPEDERVSSSITYEGNTIVKESETVESDVVVKGGDLTVLGSIEGDVLVVGGTLYVKNGGKIAGNARVINGNIVKEEGGYVGGYMDKSSSASLSYREDKKKFSRSSYTLKANWVDETTNLDNFIFRYNRVEGIFLGLGSEKKYYWDGSRNYSAYGSIGWGFRSHRWRYNLGLTRQFTFPNNELNSAEILEFGAEGHSFTDTKDDWIIGLHENSAAAILIHEDYRDYFGREGFALHTAYSTQQDYLTLQLKVGYNIDRYTSVRNMTEWSIFGGDKVFRPNPQIDEGKMRSVVSSAGLSTVTKTASGLEGWSIFSTGEFAKTSWGSEFSFSQFILDVRRYQPLGSFDNLNVRLRVGTSGGTVPRQKIFEFGGLGTLNARPFKSESGNRMILANAEYILNADFLHDLDLWPSWLMRNFNFLFMADAGWIREVLPDANWTEGFQPIKVSDFRHDLGFGLASRNGTFRMAFVWRTDRSAPARFIFRFARPF